MKNTIKIVFILVFSVSSICQTKAQQGLKIKADKLYSSLAYFDAIEKYTEVVARDSSDNESLIRLADCYRLTNDIKNACLVYSIIVKKGIAEPIHKYYYAQALMQTGDYEHASEYMKEYTADDRGSNILKALSNFEIFFADSSCYLVKSAPFNSTMHDFSPVVFNNNQVVFVSSRDRAQWINFSHSWTGRPFYRLYITTKDKSGEYVPTKKFAKSTMREYNIGPTVFGDSGTTMMLTRNNVLNGKAVKAADGKVKLVLIETKYDAEKKKWNDGEAFAYNNTEYNCAHAALSSDGKFTFFSSDMPGSVGGMDIWYCIKSENGWGNPVNLGRSINTNGNEVFPSVMNNKLYFSSDGLEGMGGLDIYEISLDKNGLPEGKIINMGYPVNSHADDFGITFFNDWKSGYFSSNRNSMNENDDIFELTVLNSPQRGIILNGIVRDIRSKEILPGSIVFLKDAKGSNISQTTADANGAYSFQIENEKVYSISAQKDEYYDGLTKVLPVPANQRGEINILTELDKDPKAILVVIVKDEKTGEVIKGTNVKLSDTETGDTNSYTTNDKGEISLPMPGAKIGDKIEYMGTFKSLNYFDKTAVITATIEKPGEVRITELLSKPEAGMDVGKIVKINPIYFDINKFDIRSDAAIELDKIVNVMMEYPGMKIELGSYTDCRATASYNLILSDNRAKASASYIISKGIDKSRIYGKGYGESKPVNQCECEGNKVVPCTEEEHQMNRRTEFIIIEMK